MFGFKKQKKTHAADFFLGTMEKNASISSKKRSAAAEPKVEFQSTLSLPPEPNQKTETEPKKTPEKVKEKKKFLRAKRDLKADPEVKFESTLSLPSEPEENFGSTLSLPPEPEQKAEAEEKKPIEIKAKKKPLRAKRDLKADPQAKGAETGEMVKHSLDGMYQVYADPTKAKKNPISRSDMIRYGILFVCIFGFLFAGAFVISKIYDYYRVWKVNTQLQEMIEQDDFFQDEYLKKTASNIITLTPQDILSGKSETEESVSSTFTEEQQNLVGKITQLKAINSDTVGWITIKGTVVNYPVVWSETKNYYLRRDFYKKVLSGGTIFIDERNSAKIEENRNTVIYGHNMTDGSMFASLHDFASSSVFYGATIQIATENGIFIYEPFSAHESNAYDNYFETDFVSDEDFINFCEQMQFISLFQTDHAFDKNSQIITLSTCASDSSNKDDRFAVHAVLTRVIR